MRRLEGLKKFLVKNRAYILTTLAFYLLSGRLILEMPADWLIFSSTLLTFTTSLTYAAFEYMERKGIMQWKYIKREKLTYWILSFLLNLAVVTIFVLTFFFNGLEVPSPSPDACKTAVETQCEFAGERNVSIPTTCVNDDSIMKEAIPYDLKEASNLNDTKIVCP